jgi:hypothetical protein
MRNMNAIRKPVRVVQRLQYWHYGVNFTIGTITRIL